MHTVLDTEFTKGEVKVALDHIGNLKASGPNGMPSVVYERRWQFMGDRVVEEVLQVLNRGMLPEGWNDTLVVLIPKVKTPVELRIYVP